MTCQGNTRHLATFLLAGAGTVDDRPSPDNSIARHVHGQQGNKAAATRLHSQRVFSVIALFDSIPLHEIQKLYPSFTLVRAARLTSGAGSLFSRPQNAGLAFQTSRFRPACQSRLESVTSGWNSVVGNGKRKAAAGFGQHRNERASPPFSGRLNGVRRRW
jgi:hypothetical protein